MMAFYKPMPNPIDWGKIQMPDPHDNEDAWVYAIVLGVVLLAAFVFQLGTR